MLKVQNASLNTLAALFALAASPSRVLHLPQAQHCLHSSLTSALLFVPRKHLPEPIFQPCFLAVTDTSAVGCDDMADLRNHFAFSSYARAARRAADPIAWQEHDRE